MGDLDRLPLKRLPRRRQSVLGGNASRTPMFLFCPFQGSSFNGVSRFPPQAAVQSRVPRVIVEGRLSRISEFAMAPRANWKGFLRLSLVTCPVALYPATSDTEKVSFNQINKKTGHDIALESTHTIEIDEFVPKAEIDNRYLIRPYYLVPDGKVGHDAFAVIRETVKSLNKVAIGRVVLTNREHIIALEPLGKGLMGTLLRYPYEVRSESEYFDDIQDVKITKDMLELAKHIVEQKSGDFEPENFEDHYEAALIDLINKKRAGVQIPAKAQPKSSGNVINLMDALKKSLASEKQAQPAAKAKGKKSKRIEGQREMLLPIAGSGKAAAKEKAEPKKAAKPARAPARSRKAG
jgi:DNA end-binding protein Ku